MHGKLILTILIAAALAACVPLTASPPNGPMATQQAATGLAMANGVLTATYAAVPTKQRPTLVPPPQTPQGFQFGGTPNIGSTGVPVTGATATAAPPSPTLAATTAPFASTTPAYPVTVMPTVGASATSSIPNTGGIGTSLPQAGATPDCNHALDAAAAGPKVRLVIRNDTLGPITFSMGLSSPNSFGQCGYLAWAPIPKGSKIVVEVPQTRPNAGDACYWGYAQLQDPRNSGTISQSGICLTPSQRWVIGVGYNRISYATQ
jgi:hypothetical protein